MGLREKALAFFKESGKTSPLALTPGENLKSTDIDEISSNIDDDWENEALNEVKSSGKANRVELLNKSPSADHSDDDNFLFHDDRQKITQPDHSGVALHNRVEALLNLIELCKEIAFAEDEDELWSTVIFGLLGQIGSREAAIFLRENERPQLKADRGFILDPHFQFPKNSSILRNLSRNPSLYYMHDMINNTVGEEKAWLTSLGAELIIPVLRHEQVFGFIILGKPIGATDYHIDDLLYLKLFGEILGSFYESIKRVLFVSEQKRDWQIKEQRHQIYIEFLEKLRHVESLEDARDLISNVLNSRYQLKMFILLFKNHDYFEPHLAKGLQLKSVENFKIPEREPWLWESRHQKSWYRFQDFKNNASLIKTFSPEDLSIIETFHILPLFLKNKLSGEFLLFDVTKSLGNEDLIYIQTIIQTYFYFLTGTIAENQSTNNLKSSLHDPLFSIKQLIIQFEKRLEENSIPYSVLSIQLSNAGHLENILGKDKYLEVKTFIKAKFQEETAHEDFISEVFPSHFLLIVKGYTSIECENLLENIQNKIALKYENEQYRPLLRKKALNRPEHPQQEFSTFLFD